MHEESRALPPELAEVHAVDFDYRNGDGVEFEPYDAFLAAGETARRWRAWEKAMRETGPHSGSSA